MPKHLDALLERIDVLPAVNQIEVHPYFTQRATRELNARHGIQTQAWSPIGGITAYRGDAQRSTLTDPAIRRVAEAHGKSAAQVMLRWHVQQRRSAIPKSVRPEADRREFRRLRFPADCLGACRGRELAALWQSGWSLTRPGGLSHHEQSRNGAAQGSSNRC